MHLLRKFFLLLAWACFFASHSGYANNIIRDAEIEAVIDTIIDPLLSQVGKTQKEVSVYIIADPSINAYVQGGQNIFINTGLLLAVKNQSQLAGVLAHELGHITGGHLLKTFDAQSEASINALITGAAVGAAAILSGGGGDAVAGALMAGGQAGTGSLLAFTRTQESAADQAAIDIMQKANIDPSAMNDVLKMLSKNERGAENYMRSHPLSLDRIEIINYQLRQSVPKKHQYKKFNPVEFQRLQAKLYGFLENPQNTLERYNNEINNFSYIAKSIAKASAYHRLGKAQKALELVEETSKLFPDDPYIDDLAGQIALENGKIDQAIAYYKEAYEKSQKNPLIGLTYGQALVASEDKANLEIAIPILKSSLLTENFYARGYRDLSIAYDRLEQPGFAAVYSAEYFLLRGNHNMAMNQARKSLLYLKENQPEALRARDILFFAQRNKRS